MKNNYHGPHDTYKNLPVNKKMNSDIITRDIVNRIREITGWNQQEVGANIYNKSKQLISDQLRRNKIDWPKTIMWAVSNNIDLNWLIAGQGTPERHTYPQPLETVDEVEPASTYKGQRQSDIPADQLAVAIDIKLQSVTAYMESLHAAISRLRRHNDQLMNHNDQLMKALEKNLSEPEIKKLEGMLIINGGKK